MRLETSNLPAETTASLPAAGADQLPVEAEALFRREVLDARQSQWLGTVLLEPRIAYWVFATVATVAATAVMAMMTFGSYARKERIAGWLVPDQGLARVFAPQAGVVTSIEVAEGARVAKGAPLLVLSSDVRSAAVGATQEEILRRLEDRRASMAASRADQASVFDKQAADLRTRLASIDTEETHLLREMSIQSERVRVAEEILKRNRNLLQRGLVTEIRVQDAEQNSLEQAGRLQTLERTRTTLQRERLEAQGTLQQLPLRRQSALGEIDRNVSALDQNIAEAEAKRQIVVTASQDGTVTSIQAEPGGAVTTAVPLMSLMPAGSSLQAELFGPSRAIGFVRPGQRVLMRYQPFPYQKFGTYEGVVANIAISAVSPSELKQELTGLTSLYGANEPLYRIRIKLARQSAMAYGEAVPLQPGMKLEADVILEKRRLYEWVLDPLYSLTGKLKG